MNKEQTDIYHLVKDIVNLAYLDNLEMEGFINVFFKSTYLENILNFYDVIYYNPNKIYKQIREEFDFKRNKKEERYDINVMNYVCYIYLSFHFRTQESLNSILKQLPFLDIITYYEQYHTLADERVIFKAKLNYNEKMNYIRKSRSSGYKFDLTKPKKNQFIAKHIYLKLFYYPEIVAMKYTYKDHYSFLKSDVATLFTFTRVEGIKATKDKELDHIKYNSQDNILFIFLNENENIEQDKIEELFYGQEGIPFSKMIFYKDEQVAFINQNDGYKTFFINLTPLDIKRIDADYLSK